MSVENRKIIERGGGGGGGGGGAEIQLEVFRARSTGRQSRAPLDNRVTQRLAHRRPIDARVLSSFSLNSPLQPNFDTILVTTATYHLLSKVEM